MCQSFSSAVPPGLCPLWHKRDKARIPGLKVFLPTALGFQQKHRFYHAIKLYSSLLTSCDEWLHLNVVLPASLHPHEIQLQYILRTWQGEELQPFYAGKLPKEMGWNGTTSELTAGKSISGSSLGDWSQGGLGTQANKGLCFLLQGCPCWGVTSSWNKTRAGTMERRGRNQFLNVFKYSSILALSQAYNQTGTWANPCCGGPEVVVAVSCWDLSLWSADPRNVGLSLGWPPMAAAHRGLGGSCQALCWLCGLTWLFIRSQCVVPAVKWRHLSLFNMLLCTKAGPRLASWLSPICNLPAKAAPPISKATAGCELTSSFPTSDWQCWLNPMAMGLLTPHSILL